MMDNFNDFIKLQAISTYLKSFGYKAMVHNSSLSVQVQDLDASTKSICNWEAAREFIKVRAES